LDPDPAFKVDPDPEFEKNTAGEKLSQLSEI
jgi:hypothetical protein